MVLGKASEAGKSMIKNAHKQKIKEKGWARNKCETALMLASEHQFRNAFAKEFKKDGLKDDVDIPIQDFLDWINYNEVFVKKESGNRKGEPCQDIVIQYVNEDFINPGLPRISLGEIIDNLILSKQKKVRFHNITIPNWIKFLQIEKEIEEDIFAAFWNALGIAENYQLFFEKIKSDSPEINILKVQALVSELNAFNHSSQIRIFKENDVEDHTQAFLLVHKCPCQKFWVLRRIQHEIEDRDKLKIVPRKITHDKKSKEEMVTEFNITYSMDSLSRTLNNSYLFLIFNFKIDQHDLEKLEYFIKNCWQRVLEKNRGQQKGKILLFLVAQGSGHDWQTQWQDRKILQPYIKEMPLTPFTSNDLEDLIFNLNAKSSSKFNQKIVNSVAETQVIVQNLLGKYIISGKDLDTVKLLKEISRIFNCQYEDLIRQWNT
ncbi:hypothetical protein NIES204_30530 [Planktothrix agardhii NIES-204]|jgi:hypothetical protein|nr:hypothetical protein NIES204_30530 [Planktothrix agardhii NIES-204]